MLDESLWAEQREREEAQHRRDLEHERVWRERRQRAVAQCRGERGEEGGGDAMDALRVGETAGGAQQARLDG